MKPPSISIRAQSTPPSPIRKLASLAHAAAAAGTKVYHLNIGQPDLETPAQFWHALGSYGSKVLAYERSQGSDALRQSWAAYMNRTIGTSLSWEEMIITTGASEALIMTFMVCCDPGDEFLIFDPTYANYIGFAAVAGVKLVPVPCYLEQGFALPPLTEIESYLTSRTRGVLLCNPNNPTGTVYSRSELSMLLDLCREHGLFLVLDETYREFVYDGLKPLSVLALAPDDPHVIVVDSLSKRFSLCGARIGTLITSSSDVMTATVNIAQARLAAPTLEQFAAAEMLRTLPDSYLAGVRAEFESRRDCLCNALAAIPGVEVPRPRGAFYAVARLPLANAEMFARFMLERFSYQGATLFMAPAAGFYMDPARGQAKVRLAYVLRCAEIQGAVEILAQGLKAWTAHNA